MPYPHWGFKQILLSISDQQVHSVLIPNRDLVLIDRSERYAEQPTSRRPFSICGSSRGIIPVSVGSVIP